jgi:N-acyl amino acid synthase of PEP-CTERM/exosortase system
MDSSILDAFNQYFELVPASSDKLKNEVYKLRFQVYFNETHFFNDPSLYPGGLERDEFDDCSIHYLIRHRKSNRFAATTRLVLPDYQNEEKLFPIEIHSIINNAEVMENISRNNLAEVSRFCVSKEFKRRKNECQVLTGINEDSVDYISEEEKRSFPHLTIALIASLVRESEEQNIQYWFAIMEVALLRFLAKLGIYFIEVGPAIEYYGKRKPCVIKVSDLLAGVLEKNPAIWYMMTEI